MKTRLIAASASALLLLAACGGEDTPKSPSLACDAAGVLPNVEQQILNETATLLRRSGQNDLDGGYSTEHTASALRDFGMSLVDVRTIGETGEGANRSLSCEAVLRVNVSDSIRQRLQEAAQHFMAVYETDGVDVDTIMASAQGHLKPEGQGRYSAPISYTVQLTDRGDKILTRAQTTTAAEALETPLRFYLGHEALARAANSLQQAAASEEARLQELDQLNQTRLQDRLNLAKQQNQQAQADLDRTWQGLPESLRGFMDAEQQQWAKTRQSECAYYGKSESSDPVEQNILSTQCETDAIKQRIQDLRGQSQNAHPNQANEANAQRATGEAKQQRQVAERELRQVWGSIPDDVKTYLNADYQSWQQGLTGKCGTAGGDEAAQIKRLQCETQAVREKTEELRGYAPK